MRGFGENLEVSEDSILYHLISKKRFLPAAGIPDNPVGALPDVEHGVLHSGTASAITRSLIYQCRVRGSATS
ncbi:MAG TPA: hypothetical protein PLG75_10625, partial [Methanoculleus sp.]|nr:hypothetical protein [Methanoculleus sp.]